MKALTDYEAQKQMLPGVSRTFALTIPQLKEPLSIVVTNAYLLCRIADTIEDDAGLLKDEKAYFHQQFQGVLVGEIKPDGFAKELFPKLASNTLLTEKNLIKNMPVVIRCLRSFTDTQQQSLQRCVHTMLKGMPSFQHTANQSGLENMTRLNEYCYYVAGVVGEMLTELFCEYSPQIAIHQSELMALSISFGQGLQMTNILKDFWEDRQRGVCWLPREIFKAEGVELAHLDLQTHQEGFNKVFRFLIRETCKHLQKALEYITLLPSDEKGIRRFTSWALGLAILTLRNLYNTPHFKRGADVKVSRKVLRSTLFILNRSCSSNLLLTFLFDFFTKKINEPIE